MEEFNRSRDRSVDGRPVIEAQFRNAGDRSTRIVDARPVPEPCARSSRRLHRAPDACRGSAERALAAQFGSPRTAPPLIGRAAAARSHRTRPTARRLLKLYQPAHQRFYLVTARRWCAACLGCRIAPSIGDSRRASRFVLRRRIRSAHRAATDRRRRRVRLRRRIAAGGAWMQRSRRRTASLVAAPARTSGRSSR